ncbi:MAG: hypothetical protein RR400_02525, partial [Clostridia bacterium]
MKWYTYLICIVFCISGIFCGIGLYKDVKAESYVNGSINIKNKFSQTNFSYASTSVSFYHDLYDTTDTYYFKIDKLKVDNFNGETKKYQTKLNDYMLLDTEYSAGAVLANIDFDFYDTEGKVLHSAKLIVGVQYLSDK